MTTQSGEGGKQAASPKLPKLARRPHDYEIRECAIRLMENDGSISSGWEYRELRDHEEVITDIIGDLLDGEFKEEE